MLKGVVEFAADVLDAPVSFPLVTLAPPHSDVSRLEVACASGDEIVATVGISQTATTDAGEELARSVLNTVLNRLAFQYGAVVAPPRLVASNFQPLRPSRGIVINARAGHATASGQRARVIQGIAPTVLQAQLGGPCTPVELRYGHFRSARLSTGPVEEFMHLYWLILSLFEDDQARVDRFILSVEPEVLQTHSPKKRGAMETTYTRLRNEFSHKRTGSDAERTKLEMGVQLRGLRRVAQQAIIQVA